MTITLELTPEAQAELSRQAAVSGRDPASHASSLLEEALHIPVTTQSTGQIEDATFGKRLVECFAMIRGLTDDVDFSRDPSTEWRPLDLS